MKQIRSFILLIFVGIMWWGLVYPELCFLEGTYEKAADASAEFFSWQAEETQEEQTREQDFKELLEAGPGRIIIKSKIMRKLGQ